MDNCKHQLEQEKLYAIEVDEQAQGILDLFA